MTKENVTIEDIQEIGIRYEILLSVKESKTILSEYNRVVGDKAEDWEVIIKDLITNENK